MSFLALSGRESSLVQTFCESCEQLDITHSSIHMTRRFVIQGCPIYLNTVTAHSTSPTILSICICLYMNRTMYIISVIISFLLQLSDGETVEVVPKSVVQHSANSQTAAPSMSAEATTCQEHATLEQSVKVRVQQWSQLHPEMLIVSHRWLQCSLTLLRVFATLVNE